MGEERGAVSAEPGALERASGQAAPGGGGRREAGAARPAFCSVFCVESELPRGPDPAPAAPRRASSPASLPSPRPPAPRGPELDPHPVPEPFSVAGLLGAPPSAGPGGVAGPRAPLAVLLCRVCLEDKPIEPLPCCGKALCGECLQAYLSAQAFQTH